MFLNLVSALSAPSILSRALHGELRGSGLEKTSTKGRSRAARGLSGWRARIGILYPEDGVLDDEYFRLAPAGVTVHVTRLGMKPSEKEDSIIRACSLFKMIDPDCITYGSNGGSFWDGVGTDQRLMDAMAQAA